MGVVNGTINYVPATKPDGASFWGNPNAPRLGPANMYWGDVNPVALTGTADATASTTIAGTGTAFTTELNVGDYIEFASLPLQVFRVMEITNDTEIVIDTAVTVTADDMSVVSLTWLGCSTETILRLGNLKTGLKESQKGDSDADMANTGYTCEVELGLTRAGLERLRRTMRGVVLSYDASGEIKGAGFTLNLGESDREIAAPLHLVRIVGGAESNNPKDHVVIPVAAPNTGAEWTMDATTQHVVQTMFKGYVDENTLINGKPVIAYLGDIS